MSKIKINIMNQQICMIKISCDRKLKDETKSTIDYLNYGGYIYITENIYMKMALNYYAEIVLSWTEVGKAFTPINSNDRFREQHHSLHYTTNSIKISPEIMNKIKKAILHLQSLIMSDKDIKRYKKKIINRVTISNFAREALKEYNQFIKENKVGDAFRPRI